MIDPTLPLILSGAIALILFWSFLQKVRDRYAFIGAVNGYHLLPYWAVSGFAYAFMGIEVFAAILILLPETRIAGAVLAVGLITAASLAIVINLARGRTDISCGCNGPDESRPISVQHIVRNSLLVCAILTLLVPSTTRELTILGDGILIVSSSAALALLYQLSEILMNNIHRIDRLRAQLAGIQET